jgi:hypothetical protein
MKKTGDVFWKIAFKPTGSKKWDLVSDFPTSTALNAE